MSRDFPNSTGSYLNVGDTSPLDFTSNSYTVCAWGHQDSFGSQRTWLGKGQASGVGSNMQYMLWVEGSGSGNPRMTWGDGSSSASANGTGPVNTTAFRHMVGRVGTGANGVRVFLDGTSVGNATPGPTTSNTTRNFRIGCADSANDPMDGRLAEVAVWNVLLNDSEIASLARGLNPRHVRPSALVGYWPLFGSSPEPDYSGRGNAASVVGTPNVHSSHPRISPHVLG